MPSEIPRCTVSAFLAVASEAKVGTLCRSLKHSFSSYRSSFIIVRPQERSCTSLFTCHLNQYCRAEVLGWYLEVPCHLESSAISSKRNSLTYELLLHLRAIFSFRRGAKISHACQREVVCREVWSLASAGFCERLLLSTHIRVRTPSILWHHIRWTSFAVLSSCLPSPPWPAQNTIATV